MRTVFKTFAGIVTAGVVVVGLSAGSAAASAERELPMTVAGDCSVDAFTDVADGTTRVYGSGWSSCYTPNLRVWVTLYRNGTAVASDVCEVTGSFVTLYCNASASMVDSWSGSQSWQAKATVEWYNGAYVDSDTTWSNVINH